MTFAIEWHYPQTGLQSLVGRICGDDGYGHRNPRVNGYGGVTLLHYARKILASLRDDGLAATAQRASNNIRYRTRRAKVSASPSAEKRFTKIYEMNFWQGEESTSGRGSSIEYTAKLRKSLLQIIDDLNIKRIFDGPCGDFNWMKELLDEVDVAYIGADIVLPLIEKLKTEFTAEDVSFLHLDLVRGPYPDSDLMICRDCLFHLSFADTKSVLVNFLAAEISYLLTTTHVNRGEIRNRDIRSGGFRLIDLFEVPYCFPGNPLYVIEDWLPPEPEKMICLWTREQVSEALAGMNAGSV